MRILKIVTDIQKSLKSLNRNIASIRHIHSCTRLSPH